MSYVTIAISLLLALIAALLHTDKSTDGDGAHTVFKAPNRYGWLAIGLLLAAFGLQVVVQHDDARTKEDRWRTDSVNMGQLLNQAQLDALTYKRQLDVLSNTNSLLGRAESLSNGMHRGFAEDYRRFHQVIDYSTSLLNPLLPMVVGFRLKIPFHNKWLQPYAKRILALRDSLARTHRLPDEDGIDNVTFPKAHMDSVLALSADSTSRFFIIYPVDGVSNRFRDPGYYLRVFKSKPPAYYFDTAVELGLEATTPAERPGPSNAFSPKPLQINFVDSTITLDVYYRIANQPSTEAIVGVNQLRDQYLLVSSQMPNVDYAIESITLFTGPNAARRTVIRLRPSDNVSLVKNQYGNTSDVLEYVSRLDSTRVKW